MIHKQSVWLAVAVLVTAVLVAVPLNNPPSCKLGDRHGTFSYKHLRCVGNLEFDRRYRGS